MMGVQGCTWRSQLITSLCWQFVAFWWFGLCVLPPTPIKLFQAKPSQPKSKHFLQPKSAKLKQSRVGGPTPLPPQRTFFCTFQGEALSCRTSTLGTGTIRKIPYRAEKERSGRKTMQNPRINSTNRRNQSKRTTLQTCCFSTKHQND